MIPEFQERFYPLLEIFEDNKIHKTSEIYEEVALKLNISKEARNKYLPSRRQTVYRSRINWVGTLFIQSRYNCLC